MTEAEWLAGADPTAMLTFVRPRASDRQLRLFAVACGRDELARAKAGQGCFNFGDDLDARQADLFWHPIDGYEAAVLAAEAHAAGGPRPHFLYWFVGWPGEAVDTAYAALGHDPDALVDVPAERIAATIRRYTRHPAGYLRDIAGNPFRPVACDPRWRSETVVALATGIYAERAFDRMPILADALEEAGCDSADMLSHCRGDGPHCRGCWVVDGVLGKR
jgi:hypothetical protein